MLRPCSPSHLAAAVLAAALAVPSGAAGRDENLFVRPEDQRTVLFGSLDAGRSVFVSAGAKQALVGPLDRPGFIATETTGSGLTAERYRTGGADLPAHRLTQSSSVLAGRQWTSEGFYAAFSVGPALQHEQVAVAGQVFRWSKPRYGLQAQAELWAQPTPDTLLAATLVAGSARASVWGRAAAGIRVWPSAFVGPEVTVYATPSYSELRVGGHLTGLAIGILQLRVSGGWMSDDAHRRGSPYAGLSAWMRL